MSTLSTNAQTFLFPAFFRMLFVDNVDNLKLSCPHCPQTKSALAKCTNQNRVVHIVHNVHAPQLGAQHFAYSLLARQQGTVCILHGGGRALGEGPSWTMVSEEIFIFYINQQNHDYLYG
jgi:hypothetical protein